MGGGQPPIVALPDGPAHAGRSRCSPCSPQRRAGLIQANRQRRSSTKRLAKRVALPAEKNGRRALRAWDPYTGSWHTNWDPTTTSNVQVCQWGSPRDIPLAGPIDRNADGKTDYAVFRPTGNGPAIHLKNSGNLCVPGSGEYSIWNVPGASPRSVVSAVRDLKGSDDGYGDFVVLEPDRMEWLRYNSQAGGSFAQQALLVLGARGAIPL